MKLCTNRKHHSRKKYHRLKMKQQRLRESPFPATPAPKHSGLEMYKSCTVQSTTNKVVDNSTMLQFKKHVIGNTFLNIFFAFKINKLILKAGLK